MTDTTLLLALFSSVFGMPSDIQNLARLHRSDEARDPARSYWARIRAMPPFAARCWSAMTAANDVFVLRALNHRHAVARRLRTGSRRLVNPSACGREYVDEPRPQPRISWTL